MSKFAKVAAKANKEVAEDTEEKAPKAKKAEKAPKAEKAEKASKPTKGKAAPKAEKAEKAAVEDTRKLKLLVKENPKREGSKAHGVFELYRKAKTVQDFLNAGGSTADLRYDIKAGYVEAA